MSCSWASIPLRQWCVLHIPHIFTEFINFPYFREIDVFCLIYFFVSPVLTMMHKTMMHLCIMLYTHWTPLVLGTYWTSLVLFVYYILCGRDGNITFRLLTKNP